MNRPFKKFEIPSHKEKAKDVESADKNIELTSSEQHAASTDFEVPDSISEPSTTNESVGRAPAGSDTRPSTSTTTNESDDRSTPEAHSEDVDRISRPPGILDNPKAKEPSDSDLVKVKTYAGMCINCKKEINPYVTGWVSY